jgi:hypothetical protein
VILRILPLAALFAAALPAAAQPAAAPALTLEQRTMLRCSATFALVANRRQAGEKEALALPDVGPRGREYFVRAMASLMDAARLDREAIAALLAGEAQELSDSRTLYQAMPPCLAALEASGL